jgi:hypothetical protein
MATGLQISGALLVVAGIFCLLCHVWTVVGAVAVVAILLGTAVLAAGVRLELMSGAGGRPGGTR